MIKIENNTDFTYQQLGYLIDNINFDDKLETHYIGEEDCIKIKYKGKLVNITLRYLKTCVVWIFNYYD